MAKHTGRRTRERLKSLNVKNAEPGFHADGGGLYLQVAKAGDEPPLDKKAGTKSWIFRFTSPTQRNINTGKLKVREMGLGSALDVTLAEARKRAAASRQLVEQGIDPVDSRKKEALDSAARMTFKQCAEEFIKRNESSWRNAKHRYQWRATLEQHAYPICGDLPVAEVTTAHVEKILLPIWDKQPETASRLRGRIERVIDYAIADRKGPDNNPARWKGHLQARLPNPDKVRKKVRHHGSVPYKEVAEFMRQVSAVDGAASLALQFVILTAVRTGEALRAKWSEVNLDRKAPTWTIPAERMKAHKEHRVPLSPQAVEILRLMEPHKERGGYIFPSPVRSGHPLSNMSMLMAVRRLRGHGITTHGFRSTFRNWAVNKGYPYDISEAALAHVVANKTAAAYLTDDVLDPRRKMMNDWANYCSGAVGKVIRANFAKRA